MTRASRSIDDVGCQCDIGNHDDSVRRWRMTTTTCCTQSVALCTAVTMTVSAGSLDTIDDVLPWESSESE